MTRVISADCHVNEPPWVFDRVPAAFRDRAPKMMRGADGGDGWSFDGKPPSRTFGVEAMAGRQKGDYKRSGLRFEDILPGNYDGAAHVKDMDLDGVDVERRLPQPRAIHLPAGRPGARRRLHAGLQRLDAGGLPGGRPGKRMVGLPHAPGRRRMDVCVAELDRVLA